MHVGDANGSCKNCHFHLSNKSSEWVNKHVISWEMSFHDRGHWQSFCMSESSLELANFCTFQFEHVKFAICACCLFATPKLLSLVIFDRLTLTVHGASQADPSHARHPAGGKGVKCQVCQSLRTHAGQTLCKGYQQCHLHEFQLHLQYLISITSKIKVGPFGSNKEVQKLCVKNQIQKENSRSNVFRPWGTKKS